jgi:hypothetical protein
MKSNKYSSLLPVVVINPLDFSKLATLPNCPVRLILGSFFKEKLVIGLSHVWPAPYGVCALGPTPCIPTPDCLQGFTGMMIWRPRLRMP